MKINVNNIVMSIDPMPSTQLPIIVIYMASVVVQYRFIYTRGAIMYDGQIIVPIKFVTLLPHNFLHLGKLPKAMKKKRMMNASAHDSLVRE